MGQLVSDQSVMPRQKILSLLPHCPPMLFIDRVIAISDDNNELVAELDVTAQHCQGHFPEHPVFPGFHVAEALAQAGGLLFLDRHLPSKLHGNPGFVTKTGEIKFQCIVVPGNTIRMVVTFTSIRPFQDKIFGKFSGKAFVGDNPIVTMNDCMLCMQNIISG